MSYLRFARNIQNISFINILKTLPEKATAANRLLSRGGAQRAHMAWMDGYVIPYKKYKKDYYIYSRYLEKYLFTK